MGLNYLANLSFYIPELIAVTLMVGLLFLEACYKDSRKNRFYLYTLIGLGLFFAMWTLGINLSVPAKTIFSNAVAIDPFSTILKMIMVLGTAGAIYIGSDSIDIYSESKADFAIITIGVLIGGMILVSANNLLIMYLGVETLSILSYVLASLKKRDEMSSEAGVKYILYGGVSVGIMLFGIGHIYGTLGTIQFNEIIIKLKTVDTFQIAILLPSFLLFFVGLGYKIACAPFHMWAPDVYEGSPIPVTAFFSIVPKMAGIGALVRITMIFFNNDVSILQISWIAVLQVVAALTMIVGNVSAISQKSVKRMLAYSSIAHAGFMILGVVVIGQVGATAIIFYGVTYLFMTLVAFAITSYIVNQYGNDHFERFDGLLYRYPLMAIMMSLTMFSLAGLPPMSGFVAKFNILYATVSRGYYTLAVIGALNSVVALYYYLKIVRLMIFKVPETKEKIASFCFRNQVVVVGLSAPVVFLGIFWSKLIALSFGASLFIP